MKYSSVSRKGVLAVAALVLVAAFGLAGCSGQPLSTREKGTLGGGVLGAGTGAIIGAAVGAPGAGAAIGRALCEGAGYVVWKALSHPGISLRQAGGHIKDKQGEPHRL